MDVSQPPSMTSGDLSDEQFAAIGRVVVEWSFLEGEIHSTFSRLAGFLPGREEIARLVAGKIRRIETLSEILRNVIPEAWIESRKNRFIEVLARVRDLEVERNRIVHWTWWGFQDNRSLAWMESAVLDKKRAPKTISVQELEELARDINTTCSRLAILVNHDEAANRL
jgi:hypothetical protein